LGVRLTTSPYEKTDVGNLLEEAMVRYNAVVALMMMMMKRNYASVALTPPSVFCAFAIFLQDVQKVTQPMPYLVSVFPGRLI
jgi:hypothetical protein